MPDAMTMKTGAAWKRRTRRPLLAAALLLPLVATACTSTSDPTMGISPRAERGDAPGMPSLAPAGATNGGSQAMVSTGTAHSGPIQFLPVVGAPADKVAMLSQALAENAVSQGVAILPSDGAIAPLRLKGYLSALSEGSQVVVVYVWDVVDPQGNRVSRIQGQERVQGSAADPWSGVGPDVLSAIARQTIEAFRTGATTSG